MNLKPKPYPSWQRMLILVGLGWLLTWKFLHLPTFFFPRALQSIVRNWTYSQFFVVMQSRVKRAYIDQPCSLKTPAVCKPKADVPPEFQLSEQQIRGFYENGFIGPFDAFSEKEILALREELVPAETSRSKTYGIVTPRDRHFEMPQLMQMMLRPAIVDRCAQLLGPDLLSWRSQIFYKMAGAPRIQWHQASTFMVEDGLDPAIYPPDRDELFQLTVWVAVDDARLDNGCLEFYKGGADQICTINFGDPKEEGFYRANYELEFECDPAKVQRVTVKRGQFIAFTERCIHGSGPNDTTSDRLAFNFRVIPTNVPAYPNKKYYRSVYNGGKYHLDKWGVVLLRGEDTYQLSRSIPVETLLPPEDDSAKRAA